jgi:hypothetical protein
VRLRRALGAIKHKASLAPDAFPSSCFGGGSGALQSLSTKPFGVRLGLQSTPLERNPELSRMLLLDLVLQSGLLSLSGARLPRATSRKLCPPQQQLCLMQLNPGAAGWVHHWRQSCPQVSAPACESAPAPLPANRLRLRDGCCATDYAGEVHSVTPCIPHVGSQAVPRVYAGEATHSRNQEREYC